MLGRLVNDRLKADAAARSVGRRAAASGAGRPAHRQSGMRPHLPSAAMDAHREDVPFPRRPRGGARAAGRAYRCLHARQQSHARLRRRRACATPCACSTRAGIRHAGAGTNANEAASSCNHRSVRCSTLPRRAALVHRQRAGFRGKCKTSRHQLSGSLADEATLARIANDIAQARAQGADLVVFSNHWGANFVERPSEKFRSFARRVIELGADIYHGHSAHICQGIEILSGQADTLRHRQFHRRLRSPSAAAQRPFLPVQAGVRRTAGCAASNCCRCR